MAQVSELEGLEKERLDDVFGVPSCFFLLFFFPLCVFSCVFFPCVFFCVFFLFFFFLFFSGKPNGCGLDS